MGRARGEGGRGGRPVGTLRFRPVDSAIRVSGAESRGCLLGFCLPCPRRKHREVGTMGVSRPRSQSGREGGAEGAAERRGALLGPPPCALRKGRSPRLGKHRIPAQTRRAGCRAGGTPSPASPGREPLREGISGRPAPAAVGPARLGVAPAGSAPPPDPSPPAGRRGLGPGADKSRLSARPLPGLVWPAVPAGGQVGFLPAQVCVSLPPSSRSALREVCKIGMASPASLSRFLRRRLWGKHCLSCRISETESKTQNVGAVATLKRVAWSSA